MNFRMTATLAMLAVTFGVQLSQAAWSDDPQLNLAIADRTGEQTQPKIRPLGDGSIYVSWFDNATGGYDVYLQRLDSAGNELWPHNGVLLADRSFSSTQDYDLDVDASGFAVVTFRDDRVGGTQITATRVSLAGTQVWGGTGVQLTATAAFVAAPKIASLTDGGIVVAWTQDADVKLQKLDSAGIPQWGAGVTIPAIGGDSTSASDMDATSDGGVIISMVRGFLAPKHLHAQKFDTDGNPQWGASPLAVFDGGALQTGNFPQFVTDGAGGAVFTWYAVSPLQCYAQRVSAGGTELFAHNGVAVSTFPRDRTAPDVAFRQDTGETIIVWREEVGGPNPEFGIYAQKFDGTGGRQWSDSGAVVSPLSTTEVVQARALESGGSVTAHWVETLSFSNQRLHAARLDASGGLAWGPLDVSTVSSSKSRLVVEEAPDSSAVAIWVDGRSDFGDVYGQAIASNGSLGVLSPAIPTVSLWGAVAMGLLLLSVGSILAARRRTAA